MVRRELRLLGKSWRLNTVRRARRFRRRMKETSVTRCAFVLRHFHWLPWNEWFSARAQQHYQHRYSCWCIWIDSLTSQKFQITEVWVGLWWGTWTHSSFWAVSNWKFFRMFHNIQGGVKIPLWKILRRFFWGINLSLLYLRQGRKQIFPSIFGSSSCTSDEMTQLTRLWLSWKKYSEASVWSSPNGGSHILSPQKGCSPLESPWSLVSCRHPEERREKNVQKMGAKACKSYVNLHVYLIVSRSLKHFLSCQPSTRLVAS